MSDSEADGAFVDSGFDDEGESDADTESTGKSVSEEYEVPNRSSVSPEELHDQAETTEDEEKPLPQNTTTLDWAALLDGDDTLLRHTLTYAARFEGRQFDVAPPTRRVLSGGGGTPPNSGDGVNFRITPKAQQNELELQRLAEDEFEDSVGANYVRDAIVRVAASHPDEVMGMLAAYGFDMDFE
jgi:hypothetical protein